MNCALNQIAFAVLDLRRTEAWWREGLGFLPAGGSRLLFRGPVAGKIQKLPGSATTCWCMLGRNDWSQLELFQYERPASALMPDDYRPSDLGYSRCGVWVGEFDATLLRLAALGTRALAAPVGAPGARRVCVRNPDGVYVEIMEDDPLPAQGARGRRDCQVALRYATLSTPELDASLAFATALGMRATGIVLHDDEHEAIWGLPGARCERRVLIGGADEESILLEIVRYADPAGRPFPAGYRLCDQRILNICFGDPKGPAGMRDMHRRALAAGASANSMPLNLGVAGCVYVEDPLGFSWEFMFARPTAHRAFGMVPTGTAERPALDNRRAEASVVIRAPAAEVFAALGDHATIGEWAGLGRVRLDRPGSGEANGKHAERVVESPFGAVREQITEWRPGEGYRYRILDGGPFVGHRGELRLGSTGAGVRVDWILRFRARLPGTGALLRWIMQRKLQAALVRLRDRLEARYATARSGT